MQDLHADELIETCVAIAYDRSDAELVDKTHLYNYSFSIAFLTDEQARQLNIAHKLNGSCVAFGIVSMVNHGETPNARIIKGTYEDRIVMSLRAAQDIPAGQEITVKYVTTWFDKLA